MFLSQWNGTSFFYEQTVTNAPDIDLYTDSSSTVGYGGYFQSRWFSNRWDSEHLSDTDNISMSFLELYPIVVAAILWGHLWKRKRILFHCDNKGTVDIINKGRSKSPRIMSLMRRLTWCAATCNFLFSSVHVPGQHNRLADMLSRSQLQEFRAAAPLAEMAPHPCPSLSDVMWH